jgi:hypothetical protein
MRICPYETCEWYGKAKKTGGRACYYGEPQCWRGWMEIILVMLSIVRKKRFAIRNKNPCG